MTVTDNPPSTLPPVVRRLLGALLAAAVVHTLLVLLWVMPQNVVKDQVNGRWLASYVQPFFDQSWSVFAPVPKRGAIDLEVRGRDADGRTTRWFPITQRELKQVRLSLTPARTVLMTQDSANQLDDSRQNLSEKQREVAMADAGSAASLTSRLRSAPGKADAARAYLVDDAVVVRLASLVAAERWNGRPTQVQVRTIRYQVKAYGTRGRTVVRFDPVVYGWRDIVDTTRVERRAFAQHLKAIG